MRRLLLSLLLLAVPAVASAQQRPAITGIAFVRFLAESPEESQYFYSEGLGLDRSDKDGIDRYAVNDLQWIEVTSFLPPAPRSRQAAVGLMTRDAAAMERYLRAKNIAIVDPLHGGSFSVRDPEGHLLIFVQPDGSPFAKQTNISPHAAAHRIIHAGFVVHDPEVEKQFFAGILGFQLNWFGGGRDGRTDWISMHVPDGTDWVEFMLNTGPDATQHQLGGANHVSLGVEKIDSVVAALKRNGCDDTACTMANARLGRDGKIQLNLFDPDQTRIEFMEFKPSGTTCCSPILGKAPSEQEDR